MSDSHCYIGIVIGIVLAYTLPASLAFILLIGLMFFVFADLVYHTLRFLFKF